MQLGLFERNTASPPVPEKYRSADRVPTGRLVAAPCLPLSRVAAAAPCPPLSLVAERHHAPPLYRVRWTYTGWRCAVFGERHVSESMTREEARRLFASRATMVGVGRVEILAECEQREQHTEQEVCDG